MRLHVILNFSKSIFHLVVLQVFATEYDEEIGSNQDQHDYCPKRSLK